MVAHDAYSGSGIAGPGGWGIPTQVTVCAPSDMNTVRVENIAMFGTQVDTDFADYGCQAFGIHYQ